MKGTLKLIPLSSPSEGMKVVFGSTKDTKDNPECVGIIENAQPQTEKYSDVKHGNFTTFVPHSYLNQIGIEYEKEESYTFTERGRDGVTETDIMKVVLPLHPDDYEKALPLIGKEVEFKEACLIGCEAIRDHAKLITSTPEHWDRVEDPMLYPEPMYTEEEVRILVDKTMDLLIQGEFNPTKEWWANFKENWWKENKKK